MGVVVQAEGAVLDQVAAVHPHRERTNTKTNSSHSCSQKGAQTHSIGEL